MVNKYGQVVCDYSTIILEDGVTVYPGYIEVKGGKVLQHFSDDPRNTDPQANPWDLKNRKEFERIEVVGKPTKTLKKINGKHFVTLSVMEKYIQEHSIDKK